MKPVTVSVEICDSLKCIISSYYIISKGVLIMKFKCKTCQTELELSTNENEVTCSKCGRKHTASEIRSVIEEQIQNRELALSDLKKQITSIQGQVTDSSGDVAKVKEWANYLKIAVAGYVAGFALVFVTINRSDTVVTIVSLIFTISLIATCVLLGKICASGLVDSIAFSAHDCKEYPAYVHGFLWFLAGLFPPLLVYGIYKILKNVKALDADTHRSEKEIELSELSRRSFELQNEIESLKAELNN